MKVISDEGTGITIVGFDNLVQHTDVIGVVAPIQMLVQTEKLAQFQANSEAIAGRAQGLVQKFNQMMADTPHEIH